MTNSIAILGEYSPEFPPHPATNSALEHSFAALGVEVQVNWISTDLVAQDLFESHDAMWVAPGSPYKNMEKTLWAIRHARENRFPCFGTCGGFQHMILEYARSVLAFEDAQHAEYNPYASQLFISELECSLAGRKMELRLEADSFVAKLYGRETVEEEYYCNFGVNPIHVPKFRDGTLRIVGYDNEGENRVVELPHHPFFVATLFVPQLRSTPDAPHPLVTAFARVAAGATC